MSYKVSLTTLPMESSIMVVGCGGTGSFVAEGLCRLVNDDQPLLLIDHDRVEPHNLRRQNFYAGDVGKFKSQALAERLARQYGRQIGYSVYPFDDDIVGETFGGRMYKKAIQGLIIGCVDDSTSARREMSRSCRFSNWWLDSGNGENSGQVLIGNTLNTEGLEGAFNKDTLEVNRLPAPSLQLPSLLAPVLQPARERLDCAEAVEREEQAPVINQAMATLVLEFVYRALKGTLTWMGAYIDLDAGSLHSVPCEPETVARMCGVKVDTLMMKDCSIGNRYRLSRG